MSRDRQSLQCAVITGGSSGIGFSIADYLVRKGTSVILVARNRERLEQARGTLHAACAQQATVEILPLDIADRELVTNSLISLFSDRQAPDLLVNCAGIAYPDYFEQLSPTIFDDIIRINLTGTWNMLKALVPIMQRGSVIVNVSSVAGLVGTFGYTAYAASKFGIIGMSEALRNELSLKGIRVAVLCPPDTDTPQLEAENRTKPPETRAVNGNAGILQPEQVAKALFRGLKHRRKFIIIPGFQGKMIYLLKRILPGVVYSMIDMYAKKA